MQEQGKVVRVSGLGSALETDLSAATIPHYIAGTGGAAAASAVLAVVVVVVVDLVVVVLPVAVVVEAVVVVVAAWWRRRSGSICSNMKRSKSGTGHSCQVQVGVRAGTAVSD